MANIQYGGREFAVRPGESVLDCLLRHGIAISHSCRAGVCQSCLLKSSGGPVPEAAQKGLKDTLRAQGYFLGCSCVPAADLTVALPDGEQRTRAVIQDVAYLNSTVLRIRLRTDSPIGYYAGQYVSVFREDGLARSYSLASLPHESELELHVRIIAGGAMSGWLQREASRDTPVWMQGPAGHCFYTPGSPEQPLLLVGAGTGLAPLFGIARDALRQGHDGPVWLFHGARTPGGLYMTRELSELEAAHPNFHYIRSVLQGCDDGGCDSGGFEVGELGACIFSRCPQLAGWKGYLCGDAALVNSLRKKLFLAGMASKAIYTDAFLPSASG